MRDSIKCCGQYLRGPFLMFMRPQRYALQPESGHCYKHASMETLNE